MGEWQPIETAPTDQIVWAADRREMRLAFKRSSDGEWIDYARSEGKGPRGLLFDPTHWQPVPKLPTSASPASGL